MRNSISSKFYHYRHRCYACVFIASCNDERVRGYFTVTRYTNYLGLLTYFIFEGFLRPGSSVRQKNEEPNSRLYFRQILTDFNILSLVHLAGNL